MGLHVLAGRGECQPLPMCSETPRGEKLRLAVVYQHELEQSYLDGFDQAWQEFPKLTEKVSLCRETYYGDDDGVRKLVRLIREPEVKADLVVGPTFSGVYLGAIKQLEELKQLSTHRVPVISPIVTAPDKLNDRNGWFFRTNVNAERRVHAIIDLIEGFPIRSITVLYADTEFGRLAEEHFRQQLPERLAPHYRAHEYKRNESNMRRVISAVMDRRSEALGIFGSTDEMIRYLRSIHSRGQHPYRPFTFTIVDPGFRTTEKDLQGLHYISLAECLSCQTKKACLFGKSADECLAGEQPRDEIEALTFDTTRHVLGKLQESLDSSDFDAERFRDAFVSILQSNTEAGKLSRMSFSSLLENRAVPIVYRIQEGRITTLAPASNIGPVNRLGMKLELLRGRFGDWPLVTNLVLLILVSTILTSLDLKRSFEGKLRKIYGYSYFWVLCVFNVGVVLFLYFVLAEREAIRYDSWAAALVVAMGPSVLLRTTLFETPTGKAIGVAHFYDRFLLWINEKMMVRRYALFNRFVNVITYYSPRKSLEDKLLQLYGNAKTTDLRNKLEEALAQDMESARSYLEERLVCARRLLRRFEWTDLRGDFAPKEFQADRPGDPAELVRRCERYCLRDPDRQRKLDDLVEKQIRARPDEVAKKLRADLDAEMTDTEASVYVRVFFLVTRCSFTPKSFQDHQLLPENFKLSEPDIRSALHKKWDRLLRRPEASKPQQDGEGDDQPSSRAAEAT